MEWHRYSVSGFVPVMPIINKSPEKTAKQCFVEYREDSIICIDRYFDFAIVVIIYYRDDVILIEELCKENFKVDLFRVKNIFESLDDNFHSQWGMMMIKKEISLIRENFTLKFDYFWIESFRNRNDWTIWESKRSSILFEKLLILML